MVFVVVHVLKEFLDEQKRNNQMFVIFVVFGIKQTVDKTERIFKFRSF